VWLEVIAFNDPTLASAQPGYNEFDETPVVNLQNSMQLQSAETLNSSSAYEQIIPASPDGVPDSVDTLMESGVSDIIAQKDIFAESASADNYQDNIKTVKNLPLTRADVLAITSLLKDVLEYEVSSFEISFEIKEFEKTLSVNLQNAIVALREQIDEVLDKQVESTSRSGGHTGTPRQ